MATCSAGGLAAQKFGEFINWVNIETLPRPLVEMARLCIIDCLSSCFTIARSREANALIEIFLKDSTGGRSTIVGTPFSMAPDVAAMINGVSAAETVRNDTHPATASHPGMCVIPAALALAEDRSASGAALIEATVAGYEIMLRLGQAIVTPEFSAQFRPTGWLGAVGAAAACAKILNLNPEQSRNAISLAMNQAAGFSEWAYARTNELVMHSGNAARSGVISALLAEKGIAAAPSIFEGKGGVLAAFGASDKAHVLTDRLSEEFEMLSVVFKEAPACIYAQGPSQLAMELVTAHQLPIDAIDHILIEMPETPVSYPGCNFGGPFDSRISASASVKFSVATILACRSIADVNWDCFEDEQITALAKRIEMKIDPKLSAAFPSANGTRMTAFLQQGTSVIVEQDDMEPMSLNKINKRFFNSATEFHDDDYAEKLLRNFNFIEKFQDVSAVWKS